jgi:hypothetical protein
VVEDIGICTLRQHDGVAGTDDGVRVFEEHVERAGLALGVLPVVADAGKNFARSGQRWPQPHHLQRHWQGTGRQPLEGGAQCLEAVNDLLHQMLGRVGHQRRRGRRDVHHPCYGQHAGTDTPARSWSLKEHESHREPPILAF